MAYFLNQNGQFGNDKELGRILGYVVPALLLACLAASSLISRNRLPAIIQKGSLTEKLSDYRSLMIMKLALVEGPCIFALVSYLLTARLWFLGFAGLLIVLFLFNRPSLDGIISDLQLNQTERSVLEDPNGVI